MRTWYSKALLGLTLYGLVLGASIVLAEPSPATNNATASAAVNNAAAINNAPEPGSPGDTLTREDARMAYLVYKLLDKDGNIIGADVKRGAKLFYQNCRPCHGEDGRRVNFNPGGKSAEYIGVRARKDLPTFWYQMNFGDSIRGMEPYIDEIELDEMRDIAAFAQTLP